MCLANKKQIKIYEFLPCKASYIIKRQITAKKQVIY